MPRFGQYVFYIVVACISLLSGTLPAVLAGAVGLALIWFVCGLLYDLLVIKKKAPIIELSELVKKKSTDYTVTTLDPIMLELLNDLNHHFSNGTDKTRAAIIKSFCNFFGLNDLKDDPFLLEKRVLFEYKKKTGSLKKVALRFNDINLVDLLGTMPAAEKTDFRKFCADTRNF